MYGWRFQDLYNDDGIIVHRPNIFSNDKFILNGRLCISQANICTVYHYESHKRSRIVSNLMVKKSSRYINFWSIFPHAIPFISLLSFLPYSITILKMNKKKIEIKMQTMQRCSRNVCKYLFCTTIFQQYYSVTVTSVEHPFQLKHMCTISSRLFIYAVVRFLCHLERYCCFLILSHFLFVWFTTFFNWNIY